MTPNNNFMSLYGFAFVISGLRRFSFDITSHSKKKKKIHVVFVKKKHCELSCCTIAITLLSSSCYFRIPSYASQCASESRHTLVVAQIRSYLNLYF